MERENSKFFSLIDTEEKAYILGFIAADGSVTYNPKERRYFCSIVLNQKDENILCKILKALHSDRKIIRGKEERKLPQGTICVFNFSKIVFYNKSIVLDLIDKGITPRKSLTLKVDLNIIPSKYRRDYIRGYFDGDGCISRTESEKNKRFYYNCSLLSSIYMVEEIKRVVNEQCQEIDLGIYNRKNSQYYMLHTNNKKSFYSFINYIYKDSTIYLDRKYQRYVEYNNNRKRIN